MTDDKEAKCCLTSTSTSTSVVAKGPGYTSPADAMRGPKEKIMFTVLINCDEDTPQPDRVAVVDVDPESGKYGHILHTLAMTNVGDELHHFGWNACSSCCHDASKERRFLVVVGLKSSRIYFIDSSQPLDLKIHATIEPDELKNKANLTAPHTVHCLASGKIMISCLGDANGDAPGGFALISDKFEVLGRWGDSETPQLGYNYDYWYQPHHNVMVSSEWAAFNTFVKGFDPAEVPEKYGRHIYFWDWREAKILKKQDLGSDGLIPLEVRFHHDPKSTHGFVGCALSSTVFHWYKNKEDEWIVEKVISQDAVEVDGWPFPVPGLITDILISLDDRFIYFSNWFHGDIRQYDISDPSHPKLVGQVWLGGLIGREPVTHQGKKLEGGPQMLQLSLDGRRLYVTNSLFSSWDDQFYPRIANSKKEEKNSAGTYMLLVNVNNETGGLTLDDKFDVDFEKSELLGGGKFRAHEMRYPGGDCTSDIWLADE
jgi:selenium-binding protein 1